MAHETKKKNLIDRFQLVYYLAALGVAGFYLVSLTSFYPFDESWTASSLPKNEILNKGGIIGSYLSSWSIYTLGYLSYLLPLCFLWLTWPISLSFLRLVRVGLGWGFLILASGYMLSFFSVEMIYSKISYSGSGVVGASFYSFTHYWLGQMGSAVLSLTLLAVGVVLVFSRRLIICFFARSYLNLKLLIKKLGGGFFFKKKTLNSSIKLPQEKKK